MTDTMLSQLAEPFPASDVQWMPKVVSKDKTKGLAIPFIDASTVEDRLDEVVGPDNWQTSYELLHDGNALCKLSIWSEVRGQWISKQGVGGPHPSMQDAAGKIKSAFSDALKKAAVQWGIGRYLKNVDGKWCALNEYKQLKEVPQLPAWALPKKQAAAPAPNGHQANGHTAKPGKISPKQVKVLLDWATSTSSDMDALLQHYKVASLNDLTEAQGKDCYEKLVKKKEQQDKEASIIDNAAKLTSEAIERGEV